MVKKEKIGLLTERQLQVLSMRKMGKKHEEIAKELGTSPENIYILEKRALKNLKTAFDTIKAAISGNVVLKIKVEKGTKLIEVPSLLIKKADEAGIKLKGNFTKIYDDIHYEASGSVKGNEVVKDIYVYILTDGSFYVLSEDLEKEEQVDY